MCVRMYVYTANNKTESVFMFFCQLLLTEVAVSVSVKTRQQILASMYVCVCVCMYVCALTPCDYA